jgi:hypothetical protein
MGGEGRRAWADFEFGGRAKMAPPATRSTSSRPSSSRPGATPPCPGEAQWAESVKKVGQDPKKVMESLKANLAKYKPACKRRGTVPARTRANSGAALFQTGPMKRQLRGPLHQRIEWLAAIFVGIVALNIFVNVLLRKFFSTSIPDYYDFGRMLLGILIFWGIAATSYRGGHITVDLVWTAVGKRGSAPSTCSPRWCCCSWWPCRRPCCSTR